ncbi:hypothetical protein AB0B12_40165 [Streptomyces sp. NPDC044780]|uniref:Excreted virulence factor EspC (Type VII ESX diderm) n=1 Tax=Streptomyces luomodiensis TaxID=3026192 RepID=A0ABY9V3P0_9ACTN|nr:MULTISPECIES: hypothetical protein [unclassified Streptomyces]WAP58647.1 hypothetical protein N6H00_28855 [Streptomyces sp. S465]WNE99221.1 hypothetical protein PS467_29770 [Streptomyces sp. SCA4-21]
MSKLKVITDAIRADAKMWDEQGRAIGTVGTNISGLKRDRLQVGMYQMFFGAYMDAIDHLSGRCSEGEKRMTEIADALVKNAKAYDDHEVETTKSVEDAY